ncbi:MAG: hypothetical protein V9G20_23925 [Candidatus Promineifilaceae bacterium]|nr:hypothetical protein [Chloroflexota bacterium]
MMVPRKMRFDRVWYCLLTVGISISSFYLVIAFSIPAISAEQNNIMPQWIEFTVTDRSSTSGVDIDGNRIVWSEYYESSNGNTCLPPENTHLVRYGGVGRSIISTQAQPLPPEIDHDICLFNTQTNEYVALTNTGSEDRLPQIDGEWFAYIRGAVNVPHVYATNLNTGQVITVFKTVPDGFTQWIRLQGNVLVAEINAPIGVFLGKAIMAYDLTAQERITIVRTLDYDAGYPDVYSRTIVWQEAISPTWDYQIVGYDLDSQIPFTVSARPGNERFPRIDGDLIVWEWQGDIVGYNLATNSYLTITQAPGVQTLPTVQGDLVAWMDYRHGQWDIYAYDLSEGIEYQISDSPVDDWNPAIWSDVIMWERLTADVGVYAARKMSHFLFLPAIRR